MDQLMHGCYSERGKVCCFLSHQQPLPSQQAWGDRLDNGIDVPRGKRVMHSPAREGARRSQSAANVRSVSVEASNAARNVRTTFTGTQTIHHGATPLASPASTQHASRAAQSPSSARFQSPSSAPYRDFATQHKTQQSSKATQSPQRGFEERGRSKATQSPARDGANRFRSFSASKATQSPSKANFATQSVQSPSKGTQSYSKADFGAQSPGKVDFATQIMRSPSKATQSMQDPTLAQSPSKADSATQSVQSPSKATQSYSKADFATQSVQSPSKATQSDFAHNRSTHTVRSPSKSTQSTMRMHSPCKGTQTPQKQCAEKGTTSPARDRLGVSAGVQTARPQTAQRRNTHSNIFGDAPALDRLASESQTWIDRKRGRKKSLANTAAPIGVRMRAGIVGGDTNFASAAAAAPRAAPTLRADGAVFFSKGEYENLRRLAFGGRPSSAPVHVDVAQDQATQRGRAASPSVGGGGVGSNTRPSSQGGRRYSAKPADRLGLFM